MASSTRRSFPLHKRRSDEAHDATLQWGKERAQGWLKILDEPYRWEPAITSAART